MELTCATTDVPDVMLPPCTGEVPESTNPLGFVPLTVISTRDQSGMTDEGGDFKRRCTGGEAPTMVHELMCLTGEFSRIPAENEWHVGRIKLVTAESDAENESAKHTSTELHWENNAGKSWELIPDLVNLPSYLSCARCTT